MTSVWDQIKDWVIVGVLLAVSLGVMLAQNQVLVRSVRAGSLEVTARVESAFAWVGNYFRALDENDRLRRENIALAGEVARSREARQENSRLEALVGLRDTAGIPLHPARIVTKDFSGQRNFLTINAGAADSIETDMPVIDERGAVLGRVTLVSQHYARVMPYLNTDFRVPAKVQSLGAEGIVRWTGEAEDQLLMEHVVRTETVLPGQLIVTSGYSGTFPPGLAVGFVDSTATQPGRNEYRVFLTPSSPLSDTRYAVVLLRTPDPRRVALEEQPTQQAAQ